MNVINSYISFVVSTSTEYPPTNMTGNTTAISGQAYGNGTYVASGSSTWSGWGTNADPWFAFDKTAPTSGDPSGYITNVGTYKSSAPYGTYIQAVSTTVSGTAYNGEWLQLQLPAAVTITSYSITGTVQYYRMPYTWVLAGSTNGTTWTMIDNKSAANISFTANQVQNFTVSSASYNYYRIIITSTQPSALTDGFSGMNELKLFV